jgi:outer membrane protein OmpA-like peptidoglycan-associated protein
MKMRPGHFVTAVIALFVAVAGGAVAERSSGSVPQNVQTYRIVFVPGTITSINYQHRESTEIGFRGTQLLPQASGSAKVTSRTGRISIDAEFKNLQPAQKFDPEFWTYVLWAITPEGKANNLGEILLDGDHSKISVTTSLQTFGLIVTAEPYFAVSEPSDAVVLENVVLPGTTGTIDQMNANYQRLGKEVYRYDFARVSASYPQSKYPTVLELNEARNAVAIARAAGAAQYASGAFNNAVASLTQAEQLMASGHDRKSLIQSSRDAVQNAADATRISLQARQDEVDAQERDAAARRTAEAQAAAASAAAAQQQDEIARQRAELAQQQAQAQAQQAQAQAAQDAAARAQAEAQAARDQQNAAAAQQQAAAAQEAATKAEREREELRSSLLEQFNRILPTTDTPQGLKVNIADVLFATGKYDLQPAAREALAKFTGIVIAHPGLRMAVGGYTDSVGGDTFNLTLSENRANVVKAYLINQGIDPGSITSSGYGKSNPVADNGTAAGRQLNRRVEIMISGEIIGAQIGGAGGVSITPAPSGGVPRIP